MPGRLAGKVILITGAARGQGEAAARLCAREGASVVLGDILTELGAAVADEIGAEARFTKLDVTSESDWQRAVELAETEFGGLHGLLNNAGIFSPEALAETSPELWARVVATNQTGPYLGMRAAVPAIRRSGGGSIVNVSSILARLGSEAGAGFAYPPERGADERHTIEPEPVEQLVVDEHEVPEAVDAVDRVPRRIAGAGVVGGVDRVPLGKRDRAQRDGGAAAGAILGR